jgi:hypothetical protein
MEAQIPAAGPLPSYPPKEPVFQVKVLWKWSLLALLALVSWGMWQCSSAFRMASQLAGPAVEQFHEQLDSAQYDAICGAVAQGFCGSGADGDSVRFLKGVHEKLGGVRATEKGNVNVNSGTNGTFLTIQYNTTFALGPGVETFTWIKNGNALKLYRYNVQSNAVFVK